MPKEETWITFKNGMTLKCHDETEIREPMRGQDYSFLEYYNELWMNSKKQLGWECPACGCGNAPWASKCGHRKKKEVKRW